MSSPPSPSAGAAPTVAFDVGALHGPRTGVGHAVAGTFDALRARDDIELAPFVTSMRARPASGTRRLPMPAALAVRWWAHWSPPLDTVLGRPDVVHGTNYVVPPARCPRVVSVYDCWFLERPDLAAPDVGRRAQALRRAVADGATVVTSSKATAARVRALLDTDRVRAILLGPPPPLPAVTSPAPVDRPDDPPGPDTDASPYLLVVGTIERRKNIPLLVDAFARVAAEHPTVRLVVAGRPGDDSTAVDRALWRLDRATASRITLLGEVDTARRDQLLAGAAALVYPSLDEGFGFPILEAARAGVPVVASTAGSIPEVAGDGALLSEPTDAEALAANLHWVLSDASIGPKLVARAARNLARFSWERCAREHADLYRELAGTTTT